MQRGQILIRILELLHEQATTQIDFFRAVLVSGYGASSSKIEYEYQKLQRISSRQKSQKEDLRNKKLRLQKFLSKLKRDGLIKKIKGPNAGFIISNRGKAKLIELKKKFPNKYYEVKGKETSPVIISFDIPENFARKRAWLREVIRNLGFEMVHKSVWVGNIKLPEQLVLDLDRMNILEFIEIFEVSKTGTLIKINKV